MFGLSSLSASRTERWPSLDAPSLPAAVVASPVCGKDYVSVSKVIVPVLASAKRVYPFDLRFRQ